MFIDTHAHLNDEKLKDNAAKIVKNAYDNNVKKIICSSYNLISSIDAVNFTSDFDNVYATIGVHPENCDEYNENIENEFKELAKNKKVLAIGEIGLDYHYTKENKELQKEVFIKQILLANELKLPIVIHTRDAIGDTMEIIRKYKQYICCGCVFHCFHESKEVLKEIMDLGYYVSYGGAITFNNAGNLREIVKCTPIDRILTETDCPYMTPVPFRGEINEPKHISLVIKKISEIKDIDLDEMEKIIETNVKNSYKI